MATTPIQPAGNNPQRTEEEGSPRFRISHVNFKVMARQSRIAIRKVNEEAKERRLNRKREGS